jgi:energy-converting hydrogenase A subunit M
MTPIQEVIQWAETRDMRNYPNKYAFRQGIVTKLKQALEKEKEQIIDAYYGNIDGIYGYREAGEKYYNKTYQNK